MGLWDVISLARSDIGAATENAKGGYLSEDTLILFLRRS